MPSHCTSRRPGEPDTECPSSELELQLLGRRRGLGGTLQAEEVDSHWFAASGNKGIDPFAAEDA